MNVINTGNTVVDAMGQIKFEGNITPDNWYKTITRENGKAYLLAISILSEIVFWYRPGYHKDEATGEVTYYKRFRADYLQKSYADFADHFGESKRSVKAAMDCLEDLGIIRRIFENVALASGGVATNVMYIDLDVKRLWDVTFVKPKASDEEAETPENTHVTEFCNMIPQNFVGYPSEFCDRVPQNFEGYPTERCDTNTENTAETTTESTNPSILSIQREVDIRDGKDEMEAIQQEVKQRVLYDVIRKESPGYKWLLDSLVALITEVLFLRRDIMISGERIPFALVEERLCSYNHRTMTYVLECLREQKGKIKNKRQYLLAALINAPATKMAAIQLDMQNTLRWEG